MTTQRATAAGVFTPTMPPSALGDADERGGVTWTVSLPIVRRGTPRGSEIASVIVSFLPSSMAR